MGWWVELCFWMFFLEKKNWLRICRKQKHFTKWSMQDSNNTAPKTKKKSIWVLVAVTCYGFRISGWFASQKSAEHCGTFQKLVGICSFVVWVSPWNTSAGIKNKLKTFSPIFGHFWPSRCRPDRSPADINCELQQWNSHWSTFFQPKATENVICCKLF